VARHDEDGSALLLVPVLSLVAAVCLALVIETATAYVTWSQLTNTASTCSLAAARDVSVASYQASGAITLDRSLATATATSCAHSLARGAGITLAWPGPRSITLSLKEPAPAGLANWLGIGQGFIDAHATATLADRAAGGVPALSHH